MITRSLPIGVVISGGQTGADQGGLRAARLLRLRTGGYAPQGWRTEDGSAPWLSEWGLVQSSSSGYNERTEMNVLWSDLTFIFGDTRSAGSKLTLGYVREYRRLFSAISYPIPGDKMDKVLLWLAQSVVTTMSQTYRTDHLRRIQARGHWIINVAGNRESRAPGLGDAVEDWLSKLIERHNASVDAR